MTSRERRFTPERKCGHCSHRIPMEVVASYSQVRSYTDDSSGIGWEAGPFYDLLLCPACSKVTLQQAYWHDGHMDVPEGHTDLYPSDSKLPRGLPDEILRALQAAQRVRGVDPNAYAVLSGRLLELVCADRGANGRTLDNKLTSLAAAGEIPDKLVGVAKSLRLLRNVGAHASLGELTEAEVPILDDLANAILEYVYSAPYLAQQAEDRVKRLRAGPKSRDDGSSPDEGAS